MLARAFRWTLLWLVYAAIAAMVLNAFMLKWGFLNDAPEKDFRAMTTHTAVRPYAYRVLAPTVVSFLADHAPRAFRERVVAKGEEPADARPFPRAVPEHFHFSPNDVAAQYIGYFFLFGSLLGVLFALRFLFADESPMVRDFAPVVCLVLLPITFTCGGYMYDFPELALLALGFALLLRKNWTLYFVVLIVACLNKESDILMGIYFVALYFRELPRKRFLALLALHGLGLAAVLGVRMALAHNPGVGAENHLAANLGHLFSHRPYFAFQDIYAPLIPVPRPFNVVVLFLIGFAALYAWRDKPAPIKRAFVYSMAVLVPLFVVFGWYDEVRAFYLAVPPLLLLTMDTLRRVYGNSGQDLLTGTSQK